MYHRSPSRSFIFETAVCRLQELINTQEQFHVVLDELNRVKTEQRQELDELQVKHVTCINCLVIYYQMLFYITAHWSVHLIRIQK